MDMPNLAAKFVDEFDRINELVNEVRRVKIEPERRMVLDRFQRAPGSDQIVGDLCWVHFQRKVNAVFLELIQDWQPLLGKELIPPVDHGLCRRREEIEILPDRASREAVDDLDSHSLCSGGGVLQLLLRAGAYTIRRAISPQ